MMITLTGVNDFALKQSLRQLTADFLTEHGDMALERLDGEEVSIERLGEALASVPFLASKKMVQLKRPSANKQFLEQFEALLNGIPETTNVILIEPKLDKRGSYYKFLKKSTDYREFSALDAGDLSRWLASLAKEQGGSLSAGDARYLVDRVGLSQQLLAHELEKLLLYSSQVTRETIDLLTDPAPQSTVFELLEAAFNGNTNRALQLYTEQRALKVEPPQIIAMLSWQLHIVALIKTAGQRTPEAIAGEAKVSPYVVKKSTTIARKLTLAKLKELLAELASIDGRSKRETFNIDDALQYYILTLSPKSH